MERVCQLSTFMCVGVPLALFVCRPAAYTKAQRGYTHRWVNKAIVYYFVSYYVGRDQLVLIFLSQLEEERRLAVNVPIGCCIFTQIQSFSTPLRSGVPSHHC